MKKILFFVLWFGFVFASCKNTQEHRNELPEVKTHKVSFAVEDSKTGTLTAQIKGGHKLTTSPSMVENGKTIIFTASPNKDYIVESWFKGTTDVTAQATDDGKKYELTITEAVEVRVKFKKATAPSPKKVKVNFSVDGGNGQLKAKVEGDSTEHTNGTTGIDVEKGKTVVFTAKPDDNYEVENWTVGGISVTDGAINEKKTYLLVVSENVEVKVKFKKKEVTHPQTHKITFEAGEGGIIVGEYYEDLTSIGNSPATVKHGSHIMFSATSNEGFLIKEWTYNGEVVNGVRQGYDFVVEEDAIVTVSFKKKPPEPVVYRTINFSVEGNMGGTLKVLLDDGEDLGHSPITVKKNTYVNFIAEPKEDYKVEQWTQNGRLVAGNNTNKYRLKISNNVNVVVKFQERIVEKVKIKFGVEGEGGNLEAKIQGKEDNLTNGSDGVDVEKGETIIFTAKPDSSFEVDGWIGLLGGKHSGENPVIVLASGNLDVKVKFKKTTEGKWKKVKYSNLENYLSNEAKTGEINYLWITDVLAKDMKGIHNIPPKSSNLGQILKKKPEIKVALKFDNEIEDLKDMYATFLQCNNLVEVENIPEGVESLRECFMGCASLKRVGSIPTSVKSLYACFNACKSLIEPPNIPEGVENMTLCFGMCEALKEAPLLPNSVTNLQECFLNCPKLKKAPLIPANVTNLSGTFMMCMMLDEMPEIPSKVETIKNCFMACMMLTKTKIIPESVKDIGGAFESCMQITSITLNCEYNAKFKDAFKDCMALSQIPNSISVPNAQLVAYKTGAGIMGCPQSCFVGH